MKYHVDQKKEQIRTIFELWYKNPRMEIQEIGEILELNYRTVKSRIKEAITQGYIVGPQLRKKSFMNFITYEYLVNCEDRVALYKELLENEYIVYHAIMRGFCNFRIVSEKILDIDGTMVFGPCTDHYMSFPPDISWNESMSIVNKMVQTFDPEHYTPKIIFETHWDEKVYWTDVDEILYREFKYDFRKPLNTIARKKYNMYKRDADRWLKKVPDCCSIFTAYFPETVSEYDPYVYMIETDYEDFVIDVFSQLPTSIYYYKVSNKLFIHAWLDRGSMKSIIPLRDITKLHMLTLMRDLKKKEIVKSIAHAEVSFYWRRE
jgi:hypothetical protein